MINMVTQFVRRVRSKIFYLLLGLSVGSGGLILAQTCPGLGQCANCGACLSGLPLLAILIFWAYKKRGKTSHERKGCITNMATKRSTTGIITKEMREV